MMIDFSNISTTAKYKMNALLNFSLAFIHYIRTTLIKSPQMTW